MTEKFESKEDAVSSRTDPPDASEFDLRALDLLFKQVEIIIDRNKRQVDLEGEGNLRSSGGKEEYGSEGPKLGLQLRIMIFKFGAAVFFLLVGAVLAMRGFQDVGLFVLGCAAGLLAEPGVSAR